MCRPLEPRHTSHITPSQPHQSVRVACHTAAQLAATSFCFVNLLIEILIHSPSCCPLFVSWCGRNYSVDHNCHVDISSGSVMTKRSTAAQWGQTAPHTTGQGHGARVSPGHYQHCHHTGPRTPGPHAWSGDSECYLELTSAHCC